MYRFACWVAVPLPLPLVLVYKCYIWIDESLMEKPMA